MKEMITVFTETRHRDKPRPSRSFSTLMAWTRRTVEWVNSRVLGDAKNSFAFGVNAAWGLRSWNLSAASADWQSFKKCLWLCTNWRHRKPGNITIMVYTGPPVSSGWVSNHRMPGWLTPACFNLCVEKLSRWRYFSLSLSLSLSLALALGD